MRAATDKATADEDGVSFWIPGFFGSLAATPQQPGWSLAAINYYTDVSASGSAAVAREIRIGQFNPTINLSVSANVHAKVDLPMLIPTYVFATPFFGGQASASLLGLYGNNDSALNATFGNFNHQKWVLRKQCRAQTVPVLRWLFVCAPNRDDLPS